ncbi:PAS domain-containing protein [Nakamurella multipartita]|jgi:PAS domain S-box-containing protein|uniref:Putative PAS/PAC sensor protein n=1 Tax=Nakamurella multipartita (strain ATCC 700099 / DSM 44233 / CIP 104796 / JCM 9543 / NBRC 105858 / Y-104) TaxID=479431 RepID=C8X922_NAKMY|nr:PAS domain-containing protein [Nakamurella multipartita]ACV81120.1 putative PAS/PAC sensor protein [Nakamurella multipartita DSM 44233]
MRTEHDSGGQLPSAGLPGVLVRAIAATQAVQGITIARNTDDAPLVYANESFQRMTGYAPEEILGHNCRFLQGPDTDRAQVRRLHEAIRRHTDISVIIRNYRRDGSWFWNKVSISPIHEPGSDEVTHFIGTQIDVTDLVETGGADVLGRL